MGCTAYQIRESGSVLIHQCNAADGDDFVASWPQFSRDAATGSGPDLNISAQAGGLTRDLPEKRFLSTWRKVLKASRRKEIHLERGGPIIRPWKYFEDLC